VCPLPDATPLQCSREQAAFTVSRRRPVALFTAAATPVWWCLANLALSRLHTRTLDDEDLLVEVFLAGRLVSHLVHQMTGRQFAWLRQVARNKLATCLPVWRPETDCST
jgi:hypothetical protein